DALKADLETFTLTYDVCVGAGFTGPQLRFGDLGLFTALLDALPLSEAWRHKLKRNYWRPDYFSNLVGQLADPALQREAVLGKVLSKLDPEEAQKVLADLLTLSEVEAVGSRTLDEITERLVSQAIETATDPLADDQVTLINAFLKVAGPPLEALSEVADLVQSGGVNVSSALDLARTRFERIGTLGVDLAAARFSTTFGRHLEYYTGFVFELNEPRLGSEGQVAGGGRYDRLLETMGAPWPVSASGAAIRLERLFGAAALAGGEGA
ncbi:MAG: ATP phosphoribosyltransferase regulatory subunit, partial [Pseudomonadota bacterium]